MIAEDSIDREIKWAKKALEEAETREDTKDALWCQGYRSGLSWAKDHIIKEKFGRKSTR